MNSKLQIWIDYADGYYYTTEDLDLPSYFTNGTNYTAFREYKYGNGIDNANGSAMASDGSGADTGASAADSSEAKTNATAEEIESMLQGAWNLGNEATFSFYDGVLSVTMDKIQR